jgi:predicted secreted protein
MKPRLFFQAALAALIFLAAGCGSQAGGGSVQVSPPGQVNLTASDNGQKITLFAGQELVIQLPGNPSTGYTWEAKDLVGSGGTLTLTFRVLKTGPAALTLVYHRSWETSVAPQQTFSITAVVK